MGDPLTQEEVDARGWGIAAKASKEEAEAVVGRKLPADLFGYDQIWGRRILVVREQEETRYGSIWIPAQSQTSKTTGWVISAGPEIGVPEPGTAGWSPFSPKELLLKRVLFGLWAGTDMPVSEDPGAANIEVDGEIRPALVRPYIGMTDLDIIWSW